MPTVMFIMNYIDKVKSLSTYWSCKMLNFHYINYINVFILIQPFIYISSIQIFFLNFSYIVTYMLVPQILTCMKISINFHHCTHGSSDTSFENHTQLEQVPSDNPSILVSLWAGVLTCTNTLGPNPLCLQLSPKTHCTCQWMGSQHPCGTSIVCAELATLWPVRQTIRKQSTRTARTMAWARIRVRARGGRYKTEAPGSLKAPRETGVKARATL